MKNFASKFDADYKLSSSTNKLTEFVLHDVEKQSVNIFLAQELLGKL
jgi:hypothetical protein